MNKSSRASIYIREHTSAIIGPTGKGELSSRLAAILNRYNRLIKELTPDLSEAEWNAIFDANNGTDVFADELPPPAMVWANVADSPGLGEKWGIDQAKLVKRLSKLSAAELLAVQEVCVRFWMSGDVTVDDVLRLLRRAKA